MHVVLRGPGADEQLGTDLRVGVALGSEPGDLRLLHGKGLACVHGALADYLAGGLEFPAGPFGECLGPEPAKHVVGGPQVLACFCSPLLAAQYRSGIPGEPEHPSPTPGGRVSDKGLDQL